MKKLILLLLMAAATGGSAWAQKGMQGIGANFAMNIGDEAAIGGSLKYQYNITNYVRIEPSISFYGEADETFGMSILLNGHFFFFSPRVVRPYLFVGAGYGEYYGEQWTYAYDKYYSHLKMGSESCFVGNAGLGLDWRISHKFSLQLEAGVMTNFDDDGTALNLKANIGFAYNF